MHQLSHPFFQSVLHPTRWTTPHAATNLVSRNSPSARSIHVNYSSIQPAYLFLFYMTYSIKRATAWPLPQLDTVPANRHLNRCHWHNTILVGSHMKASISSVIKGHDELRRKVGNFQLKVKKVRGTKELENWQTKKKAKNRVKRKWKRKRRGRF